jgi:hypothetical protein
MLRLLTVVLLLCTMVIAGCGGGNEGSVGLNGSVTVTGSQVASDSSSNVTFTIQYKNPLKTDLIGVPINFTVTVDGVIIDQQATNFNNSGILSVTYNVGKVDYERAVHCVANSSNLVGSDTVKVSAVGTLEITPLSETFAATDLIGSFKDFTISGGLQPYSYVITQTPDSLVTPVTGASSVRLVRASEDAGIVTIAVTDSLGTTVNAQVTLDAVPPPAP